MSDIIAVFWDFEHFHFALMLEKFGQSRMKKGIGRPQPKTIKVEAVMDYARSFGQVFLNEAYANWHNLSKYADSLQLEETTLIQVFSKDQYQPADVFPNLVNRVKLFVGSNETVNHVVLVGLDDDYLQLAEELKALGCKVHAVGVPGLRDQEWRQACDDYVNYYDLPGVPAAPATVAKGSGSPADQARHYLRVAAQQGVRMPPPKIMWIGIDIYAAFLRDYGSFNSFRELDEECYDQLRLDVPNVTMTEVKKVRQVLFKCYLFRPSEDGMISFQDNIKGLEDIEDAYFELMLRRIANNLNGPVDYEALSLALTDARDSAGRLERMHTNLGEKEEE